MSAELPRPGERIGAYTVKRELARGGMGAVFVASDPAGRDVALKVLLPGWLTDEEARFRREAQACARLKHPGIVRVHDFDRDGAGRLFIAMDLVEGESLKARIDREGPLGPAVALDFTAQLARAVAAAHAAGVLHRDLKPHNVLVTQDGRCVLTDFGLAKTVDQREHLTRTGEVLGTPAYMAPEQADGTAVDERTDVYGLGSTLYAMLTARAPFQGGSILGLLNAVLNTPASPPSDAAPHVPPDLDAICLTCLEKAPADRYPSAMELVADIQRAQRGDPVSTRPRGLTSRLWRFARSRHALALGASLVLVATALGVWKSNAHTEAPQRGTPESRLPRRSNAERHLLAGDVDAAARACARDLEQRPTPARARRLAELLASLGRWEDAHEALAELSLSDPDVDAERVLAALAIGKANLMDLEKLGGLRARLLRADLAAWRGVPDPYSDAGDGIEAVAARARWQAHSGNLEAAKISLDSIGGLDALLDNAPTDRPPPPGTRRAIRDAAWTLALSGDPAAQFAIPRLVAKPVDLDGLVLAAHLREEHVAAAKAAFARERGSLDSPLGRGLFLSWLARRWDSKPLAERAERLLLVRLAGSPGLTPLRTELRRLAAITHATPPPVLSGEELSDCLPTASTPSPEPPVVSNERSARAKDLRSQVGRLVGDSQLRKRLPLLKEANAEDPSNASVSREIPVTMTKVTGTLDAYAQWFEHLRLRPLEFGQIMVRIIGLKRRWVGLPATAKDLPAKARELRRGDHGIAERQLLGIVLETLLNQVKPATLRRALDTALTADPGYAGLLPLRARLLALEGRSLARVERDLAVIEALRRVQPDDGGYEQKSEQYNEICQAWALAEILPQRSLSLLEGVGQLGDRGGGPPHGRHRNLLEDWFGSPDFRQVMKANPRAFEKATKRVCEALTPAGPR